MENKIEGFEWYLPLAFKDSVAKCRFEQGQVIYRHKPQGKNWGEEKTQIDFLIQVQSPSPTYTSSGGDLDVFESNWGSKITFEKIYPNDFALNKNIETTQGRFYTYLWKDNETILNDNGVLLPVLTSIPAKQINSDIIKPKIPKDRCGFAIVMDNVSNLVISKRNSIKDALSKKFQFQIEIFSFNEAISFNIDVSKYSGISPTLGVELFIIQSENSDEVQETLKTVLFKGMKDSFNISTHGLFIKN